MRRREILTLLGGAAMILPAAAGAAGVFPNRPIRLIVPYPPGGGTDIVGRVLGDKLRASLGQPIVIDNRGGAGGVLGTELAAKATPDGYTLLLVPTSHVINPSIYAKLPYDTVKDFAPITMVKQAIIDFVRATTDQASPKFVPPEDRIATFDQDGTLWVEHPMYTQVVYCLERVPAVVAEKPELK